MPLERGISGPSGSIGSVATGRDNTIAGQTLAPVDVYRGGGGYVYTGGARDASTGGSVSIGTGYDRGTIAAMTTTTSSRTSATPAPPIPLSQGQLVAGFGPYFPTGGSIGSAITPQIMPTDADRAHVRQMTVIFTALAVVAGVLILMWVTR